MRGLRTSVVAVVAVAVGLAVVAAFAERGSSAARRPPNIVFVVTDDLSWNLVRFMPHVRQMQRQGATFGRYFVTDSLCCPSRASILTGDFPHNTGIITNTGRFGGFKLFHARGEERDTFATQLHNLGYLTGLMGKYLNGYVPDRPVDGVVPYIPPGWDEWDVGGNAYSNYNYLLNENGSLVQYGHDAPDYLTDVLAAKGAAFIGRAAHEQRPFLLEVATFSPHAPFTPAPRHLVDFPGLKAPRNRAFDEPNVSDKPSWLRFHTALRSTQLSSIDWSYRRRAQSVESVDEMLGRLQDALKSSGQLSNTYIFFTSDNGYHLGEHRLSGGKQTAFETDIRVPLIVTGPGVPRGRTIKQLTSNIDLYPTFAKLGGSAVPSTVDGRSLVPLFRSKAPQGWRTAVLIEHHGPDRDVSDPDYPPPQSGNPPTYAAMRTPNAKYVEYVNGEIEYYNLKRDPFELRNIAHSLGSATRARLHERLGALVACKGAEQCWTAAGGR
jgi:N-acetylglucosamine-6-sulfatase